MSRLLPVAVCTGLLAIAIVVAASPPATTYWEGRHLLSVRTHPEAQSTEVRNSLVQLRGHAEAALKRGPYSVVHKDIVPPSGDKHDYMSFSRYWWPNPDTGDGLPYVRRDGEVNYKLLRRGDRQRIGMFYDDVEALALAAYLLDIDRYGPHARKLLKTWFLDPQTRMNPHLRYGQAVPGVSEGRGPGIIDTRHFIRVLDAVRLLEAIDAMPNAEVAELQSWFSDYLDWLLESDIGNHERMAKNNHGAWFDAQASAIAVFVGKQSLAKSIVLKTRDERLPNLIEADGSQPEELRRTRSLHYSLFSMSAVAATARVAESLGIDLWGFSAPNGASIARALDFAAPYVVAQDQWDYPMLEPFAVSDRQSQVFVLAASRLDVPRYLGYLEEAPKRYNGRHLTPLVLCSAP